MLKAIEIPDTVNNMKEKVLESLEELKMKIALMNNDDFKVESYTFNTGELTLSESQKEISSNVINKQLHKIFKDKSTSYIYWFQYEGEPRTTEILDKLKEYSSSVGDNKTQSNEKYKTPALKKHNKSNSNVLYVGKVNRDITGRLQPHLGYYLGSKNTSGLQLRYWAKELNLKIKFNYISIPKDLVILNGVLERNLALELKPIIGRHRS